MAKFEKVETTSAPAAKSVEPRKYWDLECCLLVAMEAPCLHQQRVEGCDGTSAVAVKRTDACSSTFDVPVEQLFFTLLPTTQAFYLGKHMMFDAPAIHFQETSIVNANINSTDYTKIGRAYSCRAAYQTRPLFFLPPLVHRPLLGAVESGDSQRTPGPGSGRLRNPHSTKP